MAIALHRVKGLHPWQLLTPDLRAPLHRAHVEQSYGQVSGRARVLCQAASRSLHRRQRGLRHLQHRHLRSGLPRLPRPRPGLHRRQLCCACRLRLRNAIWRKPCSRLPRERHLTDEVVEGAREGGAHALGAAPELEAGDLGGLRPAEELRAQAKLHERERTCTAHALCTQHEPLPRLLRHRHGRLDGHVRAARLRRRVHRREVPAEDAVGGVALRLEEALVDEGVGSHRPPLIPVELLPGRLERCVQPRTALREVCEALTRIQLGERNLRGEGVSNLALRQVVRNIDVEGGGGLRAQDQ
mmetsp:Transcript_65260/g.190966  ORF Transcript_65260/g.190966 Transcript_65260/m.190966 type:complete len:299 (+) Transcript_65260:723-1619(+)